jgi:hypothetical protein
MVRVLTNTGYTLILKKGVVTTYQLDKSTNQATMKLQSLRDSTVSELELVLYDIRSVYVKYVGRSGNQSQHDSFR